MKFKKILALIMILAMVLCAFAGCSSSSSSSSTSDTTAASDESDETQVETVTLNVAYMPNYASLWSVLTAIDQGYFAEEGLEVNLVEFADGPTIIAAMEGGSIDFGYIGQGAHKLCVQGNATIICMSHVGNADAVIGGENVTSIADLEGKVVAYSSGTSSETILLNALMSVGLTMDDITAMDMDSTSMVTAMLSGSVDACAVWSPASLTILAESDEYTLLCDNTTFSDTAISIASWIATPSYLEDNSDVAVRFVRAILKGMTYGSQEENYEYVAELVAAQCATDYESAYEQRGDGQWYTQDMIVDAISDGSMEAFYQLQQDNFIASEAIGEDDACPVSDYVAFDIMTEAAQ